jgi:DNA-binding transcriptional MerR regulator
MLSTFEESAGDGTLTIGDVADRAQVSIAVLRAWERRFGFPTPARRPSGHRRYHPRDVEQVRDVLRHRDGGMTLDAAIRLVRSAEARPDRSLFAGVRRHWPSLPVQVLSRRAMLAISRAIEDECCAGGHEPVLIGGFQTEVRYRQSQHRWTELARTAAATLVFGDFTHRRQAAGAPVELPLAADSSLQREWFVVCDAVDAAACLIGTERLAAQRGERRRFEAVWSVDPAVVRTATEVAAAMAGADGAAALAIVERAQARPADLWLRATALTNRVVSELDR